MGDVIQDYLKDRICNKCGVSKSLEYYPKHKKQAGGYSTICKECKNKAFKARRRTKKGLISTIFDNQTTSCKRRGMELPEYSRDWLIQFVLDDPSFSDIFELWVNSGYKKFLIPSIDRKDNSLTYTKTNIRLCTWEDNFDAMNQDLRSGDYVTTHIRVVAVDPTGKELKFISQSAAARELSIHQSDISAAMRGKIPTAGGYTWHKL